MTTTVLLADDHVLFRQGLAMLVARQAEWELAGEASDGAAAVQLVRQHRPHIVVLDVEMPRMDGMEAARRIREISPPTRIVALSMYGDVHYQERMFKAGASAYVLKNEAIDDLVAAIDAVLQGLRYVSPAAGGCASRAQPPLRSIELDKSSLSKRERDVLQLLAEGKRMKEIAAALGIGVRTVETYRNRIMLKLGIDTLPALVKFAVLAGLTEPGP